MEKTPAAGATSRRFRRRRAIILPACLLALAACNPLAQKGGEGPRPEEGAVYSAKYDFVRLEAAEAGSPAPGKLPFTIDAQGLRSELAALKTEGAAPLFAESELNALVPPLQAALGKAGDGHEVVFAITGHHGVLGQFQGRTVTSARAFVAGDRLHLIFGLVHVPFEQELMAAKTLRPFTPGSRGRVVDGRTAVGGGHWVRPAAARSDWVTLPLERLREPPEKPLRRSGDAASKPSGGDESGEGVARRLQILEQLKRQGLVNDDEYRTKRRLILDSF